MLKLFVVLALLLSLSALTKAKKKWNCSPVICPDCDMRPTDTYTGFAVRNLNTTGPSDGTCLAGQKYIHYGKDFGFDKNTCCCIRITESPTVECNPRNPKIPDCVENLGVGRNELIGDYFQRVGRLQKDAPENGCCRDGTFKYIYEGIYTGLPNNICACIVVNGGMAPDCSSSSSSYEKH